MRTASSSAAARAAIAAFALLGPACTWAQQAPPADVWQYEVGPMIWATGVSGYLRPSAGAPVAHFNNSFSDLRLNAAGFNVEATLGPWLVLANLISIDQTQDSEPLRRDQPGKAMPDGSYNVANLAGGYRLSFDPDTQFDFLAGLRYHSLDMDVNQPAFVAQISCLKCYHNEHWTDGIVGFRVAHKFTDRWWLDAYADIGAGGSKTTWQTLLGATWLIDDGITANFGYRLLSTDYEKPQLLYNLKTSGIYAGIAMRF